MKLLGTRYVGPLVLTAVLCPGGTSVAQIPDELGSVCRALRARYEALDHLRVEFDWTLHHVPLGRDPFERRNWKLSSDMVFRCRMWIVRPHFRWQRMRPQGDERDTTCTWVDGRMTMRSLGQDDAWSVVIDRSRWEMHGPMPVLTPFEMQLCDIQQSVLELVEAGGLSLESGHDAQCALTGRPLRNGRPGPWSVRLVFDPQRNWLPTEMVATATRPEAPERQIVWSVRTLRAVPVNGVYAIQEAVIVLNNGVAREYDVYHFLATSMEHDGALTKENLYLEIPRVNCKFFDRTTGVVRITNREGAVVAEYVVSQEEIAESHKRMAESILLAQKSQELLRSRYWAFYTMVATGGGAAIVTGGIWLWRRRAVRIR